MAGTLMSLGLSQQMDLNGKPMAGCKLRVWDATTNAVKSMFKDMALASPHPWPLLGDANGRIPAFYVADGAYHVQLNDKDEIIQFDEPNILSIGPSAAPGSGTFVPGNADPTTIDQVFQLGDVKWRPGGANLSADDVPGWIKLNGKKIGKTGAPGADVTDPLIYKNIYIYLYTHFPNSICPVAGGRTGSGSTSGEADTDYNAPKNIQLLDMRARAPFGLDDMGNTPVSWLPSVTFGAGGPNTPGSWGGATFSGPVAKANMSSAAGTMNFPVTGAKSQFNHAHVDGEERSLQTSSGIGPFIYQLVDGQGGTDRNTNTKDFSLDAQPNFTATADLVGGGVPLQTIPTFMLGTWWMKL